jgi:hypothetical protein
VLLERAPHMTVTKIRYDAATEPATRPDPARLPRYAVDPSVAAKARAAARLRRLVVTAGVLWLLGLGGAVLGTAMAGLGFQVDQLQARLAADQRQQQLLAGQVAALTAAPALAQDAARLGVAVAPISVAPLRPRSAAARPAKPGGFSLGAAVSRWLATLKQLERAKGW